MAKHLPIHLPDRPLADSVHSHHFMPTGTCVWTLVALEHLTRSSSAINRLSASPASQILYKWRNLTQFRVIVYASMLLRYSKMYRHIQKVVASTQLYLTIWEVLLTLRDSHFPCIHCPLCLWTFNKHLNMLEYSNYAHKYNQHRWPGVTGISVFSFYKWYTRLRSQSKTAHHRLKLLLFTLVFSRVRLLPQARS